MTAERLKTTLTPTDTPMYQVQRNDGTIQKIAYLDGSVIRNVYFDEWECLDETCVLKHDERSMTKMDLLTLFWDDADTWGEKNVWWF